MPQIQDAEPVDHELTDHICEAQVEGLQDLLSLQLSRLRGCNIFHHFKNGGPIHMLWILLHQYQTIYHEDVTIKSGYTQGKPPY